MLFTPKAIKARVRRTPFVPIRIVTSSGESYLVTHPDLIWVGRQHVNIGTAAKDDPTTFDDEARVALAHITAIEDAGKSSRARKNGDA